jgi:hypothetical protein
LDKILLAAKVPKSNQKATKSNQKETETNETTLQDELNIHGTINELPIPQVDGQDDDDDEEEVLSMIKKG